MDEATRPRPVGADHHCIPFDSVDRLVAAWHRAQPALDFTPVGVVSRLGRTRAHIDAELERLFERYGLTAPSFAVLVTLARLDRPAGVSQRALMDELGLTAGTVSVRMDRLEQAGLVERRPDADDRRNTLIVLTPAGRALFDRVAPAHLDNERRLLSALDEDEQALLSTLLRKLLVEYEGTLPPADAPYRLGLTLAPAHVTIAMREAVGLGPTPGLLVQSVEDGSPAHREIEVGDVLVRAGTHALTSVAGLYAAIGEAASTGHLEVDVLRGATPVRRRISLAGLVGAWAPGRAATQGRAAGHQHVV